MSMEISGNYGRYADSNYDNSDNKYGVKVSTVELKTPKPNVTRTAQIKTGFRTTGDYSKYLQGRYSYMNAGQVSMSGIPTTVSVSGAFLAKCNKDPEKAKYLEENLAAIPDCVKSLEAYTKTMQGSPVCTYSSYFIDDNGNISCMSGCTNDPDGKIAHENARRKAEEQQKVKDKIDAARKEAARKEKAEQKRAEEKRQGKEIHISASGSDVWGALGKLTDKLPFADITGFSMLV